MKFIFNNKYFDTNEVDKLLEEANQEDWMSEVVSTINEWKKAEGFSIKTSGSTGVPKNICHTHSAIQKSAEKTIEYFGLTPRSVLWCSLPAQYVAGKMMIIRAIVGGMDLLLTKPNSNPLKDLKLEVSFAAMTPMQLALGIVNHSAQLKLIDQLILGGGPVDPELEDYIKGSEVKTFHTYGMTETITHIAVRSINGPNPTPYFEALNGVVFSTSANSALRIATDHLDDGSILTTDSVELLERTKFIWKGRIDNVINSGGLKIHPEEVERAIDSIIDNRFFISAMPDSVLGSKVILIIEGAEDPFLLEKLLVQLPKLHVPKKIIYVGRFEETATGKIKRDLSLYDL